jgi:hypothetical protein
MVFEILVQAPDLHRNAFILPSDLHSKMAQKRGFVASVIGDCLLKGRPTGQFYVSPLPGLSAICIWLNASIMSVAFVGPCQLDLAISIGARYRLLLVVQIGRSTVAVRICPHCKSEISASNVAAYSFGVECPKCGARLEVAPSARTIATLSGLAAGAIAWRLSINSGGDLGGVLPTLYAFLAFGIVSPLVLMLTGNLRNAPAISVPQPAHDAGAGGQGARGHGGGHH